VQNLAAALRDFPQLQIPDRARNNVKRGSPLHTLAGLLIRRGLTDADDAARFLFPAVIIFTRPNK
jgi:hypothetical protein